MSIVLIGYRGSGKTTVGRILADRLGRSFVDSDEMIVGRAGKTIREIFELGGEKAFRDLESAVINEIAAFDEHVIALGGGALGRVENMAAIAAGMHWIVYLHCQPRELLRRIESDPATAAARPALSKLAGLDEIESLLAQRQPLWRSVCGAEIDVTHLSPQQAADEIARMI